MVAEAPSRPPDRSPGLALYLSFRPKGRARVAPAQPAPSTRPPGILFWFHCKGDDHCAALAELIRRLRQERPGAVILVTSPEPVEMPAGVIVTAPPEDRRDTVRQFIDHWRPDLVVLAGDDLRPAMIQQVSAARIPLCLIDGTAGEGERRPGWRWWPGVSNALMDRFRHILVRDAAAARRFRRLGASARQVQVWGQMEESLGALPCNEAEREALLTEMKARPVWLAMSLPEAEEPAILAAHRHAISQRHRLLLLIVPDRPARGPQMAERMAAEGWDVALRSRDEEPGEGDQIYIADTEGECGLWYRLAPATYFGGTLSGQGAPHHPYEAAALGSAILHGPKTMPFSPAYGRLGRAGAARVLRGAPEMGEALSELLAPDRAAQMAHNAWDLTSTGAEVTDRVIRLLLETLDDFRKGKGM